jgi:uncharacterized protein (TIGR04141 family)
VGVDLNIYLLRTGAKLADVVPTTEGWRELPRVGRQDQDGARPRGFVRQSQPTPPQWLPWVRPVFDFGDDAPENTSSAMLVGFDVGGRVFAVTFGTGWRAVPTSQIEHDFGLVVALNQVQPEKLRQMVTKTIDLRTRERSTYNHAGAHLRDFDLDVDVEWLRSAGGRANRSDCTIVAGADALKLRNYRGVVGDISQLCTELLRIYSKDVPETFRFVQHVRPVPNSDPLHSKLEGELARIVNADTPPSNIEFILDAESALRASSG